MKNTTIASLCVGIALLFLQTVSAQFPAGHIFASDYNGQTVQMTDSTTRDQTCDCKGLDIWAINFTLDGAGNKLRGTAGGDHDYIGLRLSPLSSPSNVTVKNLEVTLWGHGIYGPGWANGRIDSCWIHDNNCNGYQCGQTGNTEIEISNSTFESNAWDGIKISDGSYYHVHHNTIRYNGEGGIQILRGGSHHNLIEYNTIKENTNDDSADEDPDYGLCLSQYYTPDGVPTGKPKHNLIRNNLFDNNMILIDEADSNTFIGNEFYGTASKIEVYSSIGNVFMDCIFSGPWGGALDLTVEDAEVTFIGTSFEGGTVDITGTSSALTVGWHVDATVTDDGTPVEGAVVQFYDKDDVLVAADTTNAEGKIDTLDLMAYVQDESATVYHTPHRFVVLRDDVEFYSSTFDLTDNTHLTTTTTAVEDQDTGMLPTKFSLEQNRPNPFNPQTTIAYTLDRSQDISLMVYTVTGRLVRVLEVGYRPVGSRSVVWDGKDDKGSQVGSGVYIYRLKGERGEQLLRKAVFLK